MPLIRTPIQTAHPHEARAGERPPATTPASAPGTADFVLGVDTCGYTSSSTISCDFGYECTNVGRYRGCCLPGIEGCVATIYTTCADYGVIPNLEQCGPHTLCCPSTSPYCFSYAFLTEDQQGATFSYVECQTSHGFGEMFPYPLGLVTATGASDTAAETSSSPSASSSSHAAPGGAIAGAVVGVVAFVCLAVAGAVLFFRYRGRRRGAAAAAPAAAKLSPPADDVAPRAAAAASRPRVRTAHRSLLRPLSAIYEQPSPTYAAPVAARRARRGEPAAAAAAAARSQNHHRPSWPLASASNPLAVHPVDAETVKRLSLISSQPAGGSDRWAPRAPALQVPTPPASSSASSTPTSATAILRDAASRLPRPASEHRVPPGAAFGEGPAEPVSPIEEDLDDDTSRQDDDDDDENMPRFSIVSGPPGADADGLVSPVSPVWREEEEEAPSRGSRAGRVESEETEGGGGGAVSPVTVSPLESPRRSTASET
ncbi:hypothetical protein GGS23DRAFT_593200 [Durotheca rogersii]|uniref:uncharacterized protein n=1 Tax=Durotheca rogersii TaxID=419775 RepID=UPI00221FEF8B|nr:uncharacterized protein GGS23DRAFT_593200 [Durotheca rogersii]KAI5866452.1 hypothetical protein GGS23DRAFT_593200 [Durotheca rogersii]